MKKKKTVIKHQPTEIVGRTSIEIQDNADELPAQRTLTLSADREKDENHTLVIDGTPDISKGQKAADL